MSQSKLGPAGCSHDPQSILKADRHKRTLSDDTHLIANDSLHQLATSGAAFSSTDREGDLNISVLHGPFASDGTVCSVSDALFLVKELVDVDKPE